MPDPITTASKGNPPSARLALISPQSLQTYLPRTSSENAVAWIFTRCAGSGEGTSRGRSGGIFGMSPPGGEDVKHLLRCQSAGAAGRYTCTIVKSARWKGADQHMPGAGDLRGNQRWEHRRSHQPSLWASAAFAGSESIRKPIE